MDAEKLFEGIALLIDLAQRGEIDPWDVQVIEVIDRYLSKLIPAQEAMQVASEAGLSQSGQAFLAASMLVLFKANTLAELEQKDADDLDRSEDNFLSDQDGAQASLRLPLEHQLRRRAVALPPQKRRVTLQELIGQLQLMATQLQLNQEGKDDYFPRKTTSTSRLRTQAARATLEIAHQENLTEVAGELEQFLNCHSHRILNREQHWLDLEQLVELWTKETRSATMVSPPTQPQDRVSVFWALLLLSAQSKVELSQEEFYQEIKIRMLEAEVGSREDVQI